MRFDIDAMRKVVAEVPDIFRKLRDFRPFPNWVMCDAAKEHSPEVIRALLELGADINEQDSNGETPLGWSVIRGRHEIATLLLECGADPNLNCPIFSVSNSQKLADRVGMATILLNHGADINLPFLVEGLPPRNALSEAIVQGHTELADFLKSRGAKLPGDVATGHKPEPARRGDYRPDIACHFQKHYGTPDERAIREIVPTSDNPVAVHYIARTAERNSSVLFTSGLSSVDLPVPKGSEQYRRAELMLELDETWPQPEQALKDARTAWPIQWLRKIAAYTTSSGNWLGAGFTTLVDEDPPKPIAPAVKFTAWLLAAIPSGPFVIHCKDGTTIQIYQLFPLYNEEYLYAREHGTEALMSLLVERKIETYIDLNRPNVALYDQT